jgi:DnaJ-domain-containing protein 1
MNEGTSGRRRVVRRLARTLVRLRRSPVGQRVVEQWQATHDAFLDGRDGDPDRPRGKDTAASGASAVPEAEWDPQVAEWYANLELAYGADLPAVTRAWKRLVARYHPDRQAADEARSRRATELVQGLNRAYDGLRRHLGP